MGPEAPVTVVVHRRAIDHERQPDRQHRHERAEADPAEEARHQAARLRVPTHAVPRILVEEMADDDRRHEEADHLVGSVAEHVPGGATQPRHQRGDADRDAEADRGIEKQPRQRDPDALHIRKRNARHQRRARIVGVSLVRTGTRITSFSTSPNRNGHVASRAAPEMLPVRIAS